jgi:hypothetical protein
MGKAYTRDGTMQGCRDQQRVFEYELAFGSHRARSVEDTVLEGEEVAEFTAIQHGVTETRRTHGEEL